MFVDDLIELKRMLTVLVRMERHSKALNQCAGNLAANAAAKRRDDYLLQVQSRARSVLGFGTDDVRTEKREVSGVGQKWTEG